MASKSLPLPSPMPHPNEDLRAPDPMSLQPILDLTRPELLPLLRRYVPSSPPVVVPPRGTALVVSTIDANDEDVAETLQERGWFVELCPGPVEAGCPLLRNGTCELRDSADVALVYLPETKAGAAGTLIRVLCAAAGDGTTVVAIEGSDSSARTMGRKATIGAERAAEEIAETVCAVAE